MRVENAPPLVIVGLDSGDPESLLRWSRDGSMPTLGALLERGWHAALVGPEMASVHAVWPTLWSGLSMRVHGRYLRRPLAPGTYELRSQEDSRARAQPFWARLAGRACRAVIVDAPDAPLVASLAGVQLAGWGMHPSGPPPASEPFSVVDDLRRRFGPPIRTDETQGTRWRDRRIHGEILARVKQTGEICRFLYSEVRPHLLVICFADMHSSGHRYAKCAGQRAGGVACADLGDAVRSVYQAIDREIGLVLQGVGAPADVFVLSNAGIARGYPSWRLMRGFCEALGYQVPLDERGTLGRRLAGPRRLVRELAQDAVARLMPSFALQGRHGLRSLPALDWSQTTAFVIPSFYTGFLRVNLTGREPQGIVEPGREYDALLDRLEGDLRSLTDAESGDAAVADVVRVGEIFGEKPPRELPDLIVHWSLARRPRRIVHPQATLWPGYYGMPRANHHSPGGLVIAAGPSLGDRGAGRDLSPLDLAPLFLSLLGRSQEVRARHGV